MGYTRQTIREPLAAFFYQQHLDLPEALGAVKRYRMAAAQVLGYTIDPEHAVFGLKACGTAPLQTSGRTAAFAVNTSRDEKLWPEDHWMKLGCALAKEGISPVFYWGGAKEEARCRRIAAGIPGAAVAPKARLRDVAAGLAQAQLMIGVDTGLTHLAAAMGIPSVGIFVATPIATLRLIGDGPAESLGGIKQIPSVEDILAAAHRVMATETN